MNTLATTSTRRLVRTILTLLGISALVLAGTAQRTLASHQARPADASRYGGTLSIRTEGPNDCLNDQLSTTNVANQIDVALMDPLITETQLGVPSPDLATSWKITNGGKLITFFLRHGVRFSDGEPFNASAVKWNIDYILNPKNKSPNVGQLGPLKTVRVVGPYTVQLVMKAPFRPLFTSLAGYYLGMVAPKATAKLGASNCSWVTGTGAFKLQSVGPDFNPIVLVRNPYHTWASPWTFNHGQAYLDKLIFKPILSDATAISSLLTRAVDVSEVAPSQLGRVQNNPNIQIRRYQEEGSWFLGYNPTRPPFNNPDARRAIAEAIDRNTLVKGVLNGLGKPSYSLLGANIPDYDPQSQNYAAHYNPADAKRLAQSLHLTGTYSFVTFNDATSKTTAELIQAELAQVGIKVSVQPHSVQDAIAFTDKGAFDLDMGYYTYDDPDILYLFWAPGQPGNFYNIPALTRLITGGRESTNPNVVRNDYIQAQRLANRLTLLEPLFTPLDLFGLNKRVHGWHVNFFTLGYTVVPMVQDIWVSK